MANKRPEPKPASARQGYTPKAGPYSGGRRRGSNPKGLPTGGDLFSQLSKDRAEAAQQARYEEHILFVREVELAIREQNCNGTNAMTTEVIDLTIKCFIAIFESAEPQTYKPKGMTRTGYACETTTKEMREMYARERKLWPFIEDALKLCRQGVRNASPLRAPAHA